MLDEIYAMRITVRHGEVDSAFYRIRKKIIHFFKSAYAG